MRKPFLLFAAIVLFAFYTYGFWQWIQSGHSFGDVWRGITSDWLLAVTVLDMSIFSLLCLVWLWRDMRQQNLPAGKRTLIFLATLLLGVVVPLAYLALTDRRKTTSDQRIV